jgi:hypothetical protein
VELVEPVTDSSTGLVPGDLHLQPNDWELYLDGRTQAREPRAISPGKAYELKGMGYDKLYGPGAWSSHSREGRR